MVSTLHTMPKKESNTVRLHPDLIRRVGRLASHYRKSKPDYLAELLGPILDEAEGRMSQEIEQERLSRLADRDRQQARLVNSHPPAKRKSPLRRGDSSA